jgi:surfeit locus 1 family protein
LRLRIGRRVFAPGPAALLLAAVGVAAFTNLGLWQLDRAAAKRALAASFVRGDVAPQPLRSGLERAPRYQRVRAGGRYDSAHQILLDNITQDGRVGFFVLTPLRRDDGTLLVVNRGWVPMGVSRSILPDVRVAEDERDVIGRMDELPRAALELPQGAAVHSWPLVLNFPSSVVLQMALSARVHPQILLLDEAAADGFHRNWRPPGFGPEKHVGYAVQWFALAVTTVVLLLLLNLRPLDDRP